MDVLECGVEPKHCDHPIDISKNVTANGLGGAREGSPQTRERLPLFSLIFRLLPSNVDPKPNPQSVVIGTQVTAPRP